MLYLRVHLGEENTNKLLMAHGFMSNGGTSPLELHWKCTGPPAAPGIEAEKCTVIVEEDEPSPPVTMFGVCGSQHPLHGLFICQRCHRKFARREQAILEDMESKGQLTNAKLRERLRVLQQRRVEHRERDRVARASEGGHQKSLIKNWNYQQRQSKEFAENKTSYQSYLKRQREIDADQKAQGKKKKSGITRHSIRKELYPAEFMQKLTRATQIYVQVQGNGDVYWNKILPLFDELVLRERKGLLSGMEIKIHPCGKPYCKCDFFVYNSY